MVRNTMLAMENSLYWSFGLVCLCGVVLLIIAGLALLLVKGETDAPSGWKMIQAVSNRKKRIPANEENYRKFRWICNFFELDVNISYGKKGYSPITGFRWDREQTLMFLWTRKTVSWDKGTSVLTLAAPYYWLQLWKAKLL